MRRQQGNGSISVASRRSPRQWSHIVVVPLGAGNWRHDTVFNEKPGRLPAPHNVLLRHIFQGALPLTPRELSLIPDRSWVETLIVPGRHHTDIKHSGDTEQLSHPSIMAVCQLDFPRLRVLHFQLGFNEYEVSKLDGRAHDGHRWLTIKETMAIVHKHLSPISAYEGGFVGLRDYRGHPITKADSARYLADPAHFPFFATDYQHGNAVSSWLHTLPSTLEYVDFGNFGDDCCLHDDDKVTLMQEVESLAQSRWTRLRGLNPFHCGPWKDFEKWPLERRAQIDVLNTGLFDTTTTTYSSRRTPSAILAALPGLRRLQWAEGDFNPFEVREFCEAAAGCPLETLYLNLDSCEWGPAECADIVKSLTSFRPPLKELIIAMDSCELEVSWVGKPGTEYDQLAWNLKQLSPDTTVVVCSEADPILFNFHIGDMFQRIFVPDLLEKWQTHPQMWERPSLVMVEEAGQTQRLRNTDGYDAATAAEVQRALREDLRVEGILQETASGATEAEQAEVLRAYAQELKERE